KIGIPSCSPFPLDLETRFIVRVVSPGDDDFVRQKSSDRKSGRCNGDTRKSGGVRLIAIYGSRNRIVSSHSVVILGSCIETCNAVGSYIRASDRNLDKM